MKKSIFKKVLIYMTTALLLFLLTGCTEHGDDKNKKTSANTEISDLIIILGAHGNAYAPDLTLIEDKVLSACYQGAEIQLIVSDGNPFLLETYKIPEIDKNLSESNKEKKARSYAKQVLSTCQSARVKTEEVNTFSALSLAERCVDEDTVSTTELVILDTMLPTIGMINFSESPLFSMNVETSASSFSGKLPRLSNININIYGIGEVAGDQAVLSNRDYNTLTSFWEMFFKSIGNSKTNINAAPSKNVEVFEDMPKVSVVAVSSDDNLIEDNKEAFADGIVYNFDTKYISFDTNSAEILNRDQAIESLIELSECLKTSPQPIVVVGMTATSGSAESSRELSLERAMAVKSLLQEELGVESQITCIGTGHDSTNRFHKNDLDSDGHLIERIAQENRTVLVMSEATAKQNGLL